MLKGARTPGAVSAAALGPSAATSTVTLASVSAPEGGATVGVTLQLRDVASVALAQAGHAVVFGLSGGTAVASVGATTDNGDGTYSAAITPTTAGTAKTLTVTLDGRTVTSTMPTFTVTASGVATAFYDNFETGALAAPVNGYKWNGENHGAAGYAPSVSNDRAHAGTYSLKLPCGAIGNWCEQYFQFGAYLSEAWLEYQLWVPTSYDHVTRSPVSNNKLLVIFGDYYNRSDGNVGFDLETDPNLPNDGTSYLVPQSSDSAHASMQYLGANTAHDGRGLMVGTGAAFAAGAWTRMRFHFKTTSAPGAADGVFEVWAGDTLVYQKTNADMSVLTGGGLDGHYPATLKNGYLMGAANGYFDVDTTFYIDEFKIYDTNPGW